MRLSSSINEEIMENLQFEQFLTWKWQVFNYYDTGNRDFKPPIVMVCMVGF